MFWRRDCVFAIQCLCVTVVAYGSPTGQQISDQVSQASYRHYLDDELYTHTGDDRMWGPEHDLARDNIVTIFESFDLQVELHPFTYNSETYYNVVATQTGTVYPNQQYLIGAHFDSYYYGTAPSGGADDNASGVAGVLEVARLLSQYETAYTITYIAFDREEQWMVGSYAYVLDHLGDDIVGMINLDMIAWDPGDYSVEVEAQPEFDFFADQVVAALNEYAPDLIVETPGPGPSDNLPFEEFGWPACGVVEDDVYTIWSGEGNPCYHQPCDTVDTPGYLDYAFATDITRAMAGFLADASALDLATRDCNHNEILDADEILADPQLDCNDNGTVDTCEAGYGDCNVNGTPDFCDIAEGISEDCTGNGIPDECEPDCNDTGVADTCDILYGTSLDCNWNDVPDDCDISSGESEDDDGNGVPDECERIPVTLAAEGGRYLSVTLDLHPTLPVALYVTSPDYPCLERYAQEDGRLADAPVYAAMEEWGVVQLYGTDIMPDTIYEVRAEPAFGDPSEPGTATTAAWGDTVGNFVGGEWTTPDGTVDFVDISATVDAFRHLPSAPPWPWCDIAPWQPQGIIDFEDIGYCVDAFKGHAYPFEIPACP